MSGSADFSFTSATSRVLVANFIAQSGLVSTMAVPGVVHPFLASRCGWLGSAGKSSPKPRKLGGLDASGDSRGQSQAGEHPPTNGRGFFRLIYP